MGRVEGTETSPIGSALGYYSLTGIPLSYAVHFLSTAVLGLALPLFFTSSLQIFPFRIMSDSKTDPTKFLSSIIGSAVTVKLHNGVEYRGDLQSIDGYMNVVLQSAKEFVETTEIKSYGDVFIRGNNGMFV